MTTFTLPTIFIPDIHFTRQFTHHLADVILNLCGPASISYSGIFSRNIRDLKPQRTFINFHEPNNYGEGVIQSDSKRPVMEVNGSIVEQK